MIGYLYKGFLITFSNFFRITKDEKTTYIKTNSIDKMNRNYYCWKDKDFRDFINNILVHLEPFREKSRTKLVNQLDIFSTVMFVNNGKIQVGYEINNVDKYVL